MSSPQHTRGGLVLRPAEIFGAQDRIGDLAGRSARGGLTTLSTQLVRFALQTVTTIILARLLTPSDYGLFGMVAVIVNFGQLLRDAGLSSATIQRDTVSQGQISNLFWANTLLGIGLAAVFALAAPLVAAFYGEPELTGVTRGLAVAFALGGLASQHVALLQRSMRFGSVAATQVVPLIGYLATAAVLAVAGWAYWALVMGTIAQAALLVVTALVLCRWLPSRPRRGSGVRSMVRFGGHVLGFDVLNYAARNLDNVLIGRVLGPVQLGLYSKAYSLFTLPLSQVKWPFHQVAFPALSSLLDDPERYRRYFRRLVGMLCSITVPITLLCFFEATLLVEVLVGTQWLGAVPVFRILAVAAVVQPLLSSTGIVLLSRGLTRRYLRFGVFNSSCVIASFVAGLPFGIAGVAVAYTIANYAVIVPSISLLCRGTPVRAGDFWMGLVPPLGVGLAASSVFLLRLMPGWDSLWLQALLSCAFVALYVGLSWTLPTFRESVRTFRRALRSRAE